MGATAIALVGFAGWFVLLSIAMALYRLTAIQAGKPVNSFAADGSDLAPLGRRLTRARDNCYESLPAFVALALGAYIGGRLDVVDGLAMWVLYARIGQSLVHVASTSPTAVQVRAALFFAQVAIYLYWAVRLLVG
ncbi:MAG: MAPEG family protein [bacterium]